MPLTLNGTTGISGIDGSASIPAVQGSDTNTGVFYPTADTVGVSTNGSERMRIDSSGNVGIGTSSPAVKLDINGTNPSIRIAQTVGGYENYLGVDSGNLAWNGSTNGTPWGVKTQNVERMRIDLSGNVGIGTSSPNSKLEVTSRITASDGGGASRVALNIESNTTSQSYSAINSYNYGTSTARNLVLNESGGNVGIGNTNPSWPLDFSTSLNGTLLRGGSSSAISIGNYNGEGNIASGQTLADTGVWTARNTAASIITLNASASGVITFSTNSGLTVGNTFNPTERMRIDNLGNVGIGTGSNLTLNKTTILGNAGLIVSPDADNSNNGMGVGIYGASIATTTGGSAKLYMSGGNTAHSGNLALRAGTVVDTTINMYNTSGTRTVLVAAGGSSYFNGGNVGIGTSSPSYALHVTGTGSYGGQLLVATTTSNFNNGINLAAAGAGYITGTNGDGASSTVANIKIASWFGLGFSSAITGQSVPYGENAGWINCRDGAMSIRGSLTQNASDRRLKENLEVIPNALDKINQINGYTFDWKMQECFNLGFKPAQEHEHGVIAQEIQAVVPDAVVIAPFDNECGEDGVHYSKSGEQYLTVKIEKIIPLLLQGIKELNAIVKTQAAEISQLKGVS